MSVMIDQIIFKDGNTFASIAGWDFDCYTHDGFFKFKGEQNYNQIISNYRDGNYDVCSEDEEEFFN